MVVVYIKQITGNNHVPGVLSLIKRNVFIMRHSILALFVSAVLFPPAVFARNYIFDASMIGDGKSSVDVALFNEGLQLPGNYDVK